MTDHSSWQTTLAEHRAAWIIASASLLIVLVAMFKPDLFEGTTSGQPSQNEAAEKAPLRSYSPAPVIPADQEAENAVTTPPPKPKARRAKTAEQPQTSPRPVPVATRAAPAKPKPPVRHALPASGGDYFVQAGAFRDRAHADKLAARINRLGWSTRIVPKQGHLYAVWVGPRATRNLARTLQETLQQRMNLKGFIVKKPAS